MKIDFNETELILLQSAIMAKIKRCRNSMANNARNPTAKSDRQIRVRQNQYERLNHLRNLINGFEYGKEEAKEIL